MGRRDQFYSQSPDKFRWQRQPNPDRPREALQYEAIAKQKAASLRETREYGKTGAKHRNRRTPISFCNECGHAFYDQFNLTRCNECKDG